jgi:putative phospholipase
MPNVGLLDSICSGHDCFPPSNVIQASGDVIIENRGCARITDVVQVHCCLHPDTIIKTKNENISIEELYYRFLEGEEFLTTCKDDKGIYETKIIDVFKTKKEKKFIEIEFEKHSIILTEDHKILLQDGKTYKEAKDILKDDLDFKHLNHIILDEVDVYDLTVEHEAHNFETVNNVYLKNCVSCHGRNIAQGSNLVIVNNLKCAYLGAAINCGGNVVSNVAQTVFCGI